MGVNNLWSGYDIMWLSFVLPSIQAVLRYIPLCWITFFSVGPSDTLLWDGKLQSEDTGSRKHNFRANSLN